MTSSSSISALQIDRIGEFALRILIPESEGRVLAVFSKGIYLENTQNDLFWLTAENGAMHRRAARLSGSLPSVIANATYAVKNQLLIFCPKHSLDFSQARRWNFADRYPSRVVSAENLKQNVLGLIALVDYLPPAKGFGIFIKSILALIRNQSLSYPHSTLEGAAKFAWPTILEIANACLTRDLGLMINLAEHLVGLGEGLTPSGDDFISGLLFSILSLRQANYISPGYEISDLDSFLLKSKARTNRISFTLLKDHACGHAPEMVHKFVHALLTGKSHEFVRKSAVELVQMGHSSGWDLLAGVLTGLLILFSKRKTEMVRVYSSAQYRI